MSETLIACDQCGRGIDKERDELQEERDHLSAALAAETGECDRTKVELATLRGECAELRAKYETLDLATGAEINRLENLDIEHESALATLRAQLPDGMQHCTIRFIECEKGHGRLTADNWIDHGCDTCDRYRLNAENRTLRAVVRSVQKSCRDIRRNCNLDNLSNFEEELCEIELQVDGAAPATGEGE